MCHNITLLTSPLLRRLPPSTFLRLSTCPPAGCPLLSPLLPLPSAHPAPTQQHGRRASVEAAARYPSCPCHVCAPAPLNCVHSLHRIPPGPVPQPRCPRPLRRIEHPLALCLAPPPPPLALEPCHGSARSSRQHTRDCTPRHSPRPIGVPLCWEHPKPPTQHAARSTQHQACLPSAVHRPPQQSPPASTARRSAKGISCPPQTPKMRPPRPSTAETTWLPFNQPPTRPPMARPPRSLPQQNQTQRIPSGRAAKRQRELALPVSEPI